MTSVTFPMASGNQLNEIRDRLISLARVKNRKWVNKKQICVLARLSHEHLYIEYSQAVHGLMTANIHAMWRAYVQRCKKAGNNDYMDEDTYRVRALSLIDWFM